MCSSRVYRNTSHLDPAGGSKWANAEKRSVPKLGRQTATGRGKGGREGGNRLWKAINPDWRIEGHWGASCSPGGQRLTRSSRTWQFGSSLAASGCDLTPDLSYLPRALRWGPESSAGGTARKPISLDLSWVPPAGFPPLCEGHHICQPRSPLD